MSNIRLAKRPIELIFSAKLARGLKTNTTVYLGFVEVTMGELNFMHCAAYVTESQEVRLGDVHSERLLDDMDATFPSIFMELTYCAGKPCFFYHTID